MLKAYIVLVIMFIPSLCFAFNLAPCYGYALIPAVILILGFIFYFRKSFKNTLQNMMSLSKKNYDEIKFLLENIQEGVIAIGQDGKIQFASNKAAEFLGYTREELARLNITDIQKTESLGAFKKHFEDVIKGKRLKYELAAVKKDAGRVNISVSIRIINLNGKKVAYCMFTDVTNQKLLEKVSKKIILNWKM